MSKTYESIATNTLTATTTSVTFSSIPQTYTDLVIIYNGTSAVQNFPIRFNSDTGANYSYVRMFGDGSSTYSDRENSITYGSLGIISSERTLVIGQIQNYSNTTTRKSLLSRSGYTGTGYVSFYCSLWRNTAAITSITLLGGTGGQSFSVGSTFTLYGIKAE
jgi:hypothetical protein